MRPLQLDYQVGRRSSRLGLLVFAIALVAAGAALWRFETLRQEWAAWEAERTAARARLDRDAGARPQRGQGTRVAEETAAAHGVIRRIHFPWADLFASFEAAANEEVALIGIEPDAANGVVRVTAESPTARAMLQYVKRLQGTAFLEQVALQKHEIQAEDPQRPFRFTVVAKWKLRD